MLMSSAGRLARLHYLPGTYRVLSHGDHVVCAVTRQPIPLADLRPELLSDAELASR